MSGYENGKTPALDELSTVTVTLPGGKAYEVSLQPGGIVQALREEVEKQHEVPNACVLKLFQDGQLLGDADLLSQVDFAQPVFGVISKDTRLEVVLQACGKYQGFQDMLTTAAVDDITKTPQMIVIPPLPNILEVLTDMIGEAPEVPDLRKGSEDGTLEFSGAKGTLLLPSIDAKKLLSAAGIEKFYGVTIIVEVNSDVYNRGLGVVLEASPLIDITVSSDGLPSYVYNGYGISTDKKQNVIKFHPGMDGGQLRVEGVGGWGNCDIGFTPKSWTNSRKTYHTLELTLGVDGRNEVCIKGTDEGQEWRKPWTHQQTDGRYFPAVYAWLDLGSTAQPLQIRNISMRVHTAPAPASAGAACTIA